MFKRKPSLFQCYRWRLLAAVVAILGTAGAEATTISFASGGTGGTGYGNGLTFYADGISVTAMAWAETGGQAPAGSGYYRLQTAEVSSWSTGLGICNRSEGLAHGGCDSNEHEIDTTGRDDLLVLLFSHPVSFESITVEPYDGPGSDPNDRDIAYWSGTLPLPDLASQTLATLGGIAGLSAETLSAAPSGYGPYSHLLSGVGNVLLLTGNYRDRLCRGSNAVADLECEAYKIGGIVVTPVLHPDGVVPVPAALWLLGGALAGLAAARRLRPD